MHHLGFRWVVNNARKEKLSRSTKESTRSKKMAEINKPPSEIVLELVNAEPVSADEYNFEPHNGKWNADNEV
jgi:hypothetical protein